MRPAPAAQALKALFQTSCCVLGAASLLSCATAPGESASGNAVQATAQATASAQAAPHATIEATIDAPIEARHILRARVAKDVVELAYSPRQRAVFVTAPDWEDETQSRLLRLDPTTLAVQAELRLPSKGFGVVLDDAANRLYFTQGFNGMVAAVNTERMTLVGQTQVMEKVHFATEMQRLGLSAKRQAFLREQLARFKVVEDYPFKLRELALDSAHHRLFAPGLGLGWDSVLFVIDTRTFALEKIIPGMGYNAVGIAIDQARSRVFVSNMAGQITVLSSKTLQVEKVLQVQADQLLNLVYDPAQNRLLGVDQGIDRDLWRNHHLEREYQRRSPGHRFFAIDADSGQTLASLPIGQVPIGLLFDAQRQRVYTTNRGGVRVDEGQGSLSVIDTRNYQLLQTLPLPPHPNSLALDEKGQALYITVKNDGRAKKAGQLESVVRIGLPGSAASPAP